MPRRNVQSNDTWTCLLRAGVRWVAVRNAGRGECETCRRRERARCRGLATIRLRTRQVKTGGLRCLRRLHRKCRNDRAGRMPTWPQPCRSDCPPSPQVQFSPRLHNVLPRRYIEPNIRRPRELFDPQRHRARHRRRFSPRTACRPIVRRKTIGSTWPAKSERKFRRRRRNLLRRPPCPSRTRLPRLRP